MKKAHGNWGKFWKFRRRQINDVVYHSQSYQLVTARNNYTIVFLTNGPRYGYILSYAKLLQECHQASCNSKCCQYLLNSHHFALAQILDVDKNQLPTLQRQILVQHIIKVKPTTEVVAISLSAIEKKCLVFEVSSGTYVCHLVHMFERDWLSNNVIFLPFLGQFCTVIIR